MISKDMYALLKRTPRRPPPVSYIEINPDNSEELYNLLCDATYGDDSYINIIGGGSIKRGSLLLTDKGQAAVEEYEQAEHNNKIIEKTLSVTKGAMWAAIASAIVALVSLIKMFC